MLMSVSLSSARTSASIFLTARSALSLSSQRSSRTLLGPLVASAVSAVVTGVSVSAVIASPCHGREITPRSVHFHGPFEHGGLCPARRMQ